MKTELSVALIAGAISLLTAGGTLWSSFRANANAAAIEQLKIENEKRSEAEQRERETSRFREPLLRSAYDLQSRLYNISKQYFLQVYLSKGDDREKTYAVENTAFVISQYFCWSEAFRREVQFTDLEDQPKARYLIAEQDTIVSLWGTDKWPRLLRIFAGEQRAIGEALLKDGPKGPDCIGYGEFLQRFKPGQNALLDALKVDVTNLPDQPGQAENRIRAVQNALIDLLNILDPEFKRFPKDKRSKLS